MDSTTHPDTAGPAAAEHKSYTRFSAWQRIEHAILILSFTTLAVTGLPQKFAEAPISQTLIAILGGIETVRIIHRIAAIILMAQSIYHVLGVLYRVVVRRAALSMFPVLEDVKHLIQDVLFYLGLRRHRGYYGRYSYAEKAEYLAVVWGTLIMILTGFMMWNPIATTQILPGEAIPAAKVAHGGEAVLAVLAIILWHFYNVHIRHFNTSMFTGQLSREDMQHEHPAELAILESDRAPQPAQPDVVRRQRVFLPIAGALALVLGAGLYQFVTFEQTAIDTVPRGETAKVFVPFTPTPAPTATSTATPTRTPTPGPATPTPGPATATPAGAVADAWSGGIDQVINTRCAACHVQAALGNLSLKTYASALQGGKSGPAIVPGDPNQSVLVQIQSKGGHPGQLSAEELERIIAWIEAGAPETSGGAAPPPTTAAGDAWSGGIDQVINTRCAACHVQAALGNLSLKTYAGALQGGKSGPAIVPGDPDQSVLVQIQSKGGHASQLSAEELERIIAWIEAGAPETSGGAAPPPTTAASDAWSGGIDQVINTRCAACHVQAALGDLSLKTYAGALQGGKSGPAIVPGDPDLSVLVQIQSKGGHASQLSAEELERIIAWIKAGAPEK